MPVITVPDVELRELVEVVDAAADMHPGGRYGFLEALLKPAPVRRRHAVPPGVHRPEGQEPLRRVQTERQILREGREGLRPAARLGVQEPRMVPAYVRRIVLPHLRRTSPR